MTTPKEALERLRDYLRGEAKKTDTCYTCYTDQAAFIATRLSTILASLQGEDAVERVKVLARRFWSIHPSTIAAMNLTREEFYAREMMALLATGLVPDEAAIRADNTANLISIIADIREKTGLGVKPMLSELADAIVAEMDRRVADEREKTLDKVCENLIVLSRGDESVIGAARVALNNAAVFICGADRAKRAIRSGGGE